MSKWHNLGCACCLTAIAFFGLTTTAGAQDASQREKDLLILVEALKERVQALEDKTAASEMAAPVEAGPIVERVEALEQAIDEKKAGSDNDFRVFWKSGLNFETNDGTTKLKIGGRIHNDWYWFDQDSSLQRMVDLEDGTEFRRGRVYISGTLYENIKFKFQYDFADGDVDFKDVYMEIAKLPGIGNLRIGHFKEPFSLEELTSSNDATFMERALPNIFAPSRNTGIMAHNAFLGEKKHERMTAALGIFRTTDDYGNDADDGGYSVTARVTGLPWYEEDGRKLVHLGAAYTHRNPDGDVRLRQRPESHGAARFVDTGAVDTDAIDSFVLEGALVLGAFSLQGEYFFNDFDTEFLGDHDFDGYYVQASYFLTGEHRPYKNADAKFDRVVPNNNFKVHGEERGWGAWEVALRYSHIDLDDGYTSFWDRAFGYNDQIRGGEEDNITIGLNWHLNPNTRIMWNYIHADLDSNVYDGDLNIFQTRFQVAF